MNKAVNTYRKLNAAEVAVEAAIYAAYKSGDLDTQGQLRQALEILQALQSDYYRIIEAEAEAAQELSQKFRKLVAEGAL